MKATETKLLEFLKKSPQFVIPIYQRTYSWTEPECQQLWNDIIRAGNQEKVSGHFIGSIVYIEAGLYQVTSQSPLLVIDGQQRLTSVMLILEALARALGEDEEPIDGFSREKIRSYFLLNPLEKGDRRYKLLLTQGDRPTLLTIMQQKPLPEGASTRVADNFALFEGWIKELKGDLTALCAGLAKLMVVDIALTRDQDNPMEIRVPMIVATGGPAPPQIIDLSVQRRIGGRGAGPDAGADDIVDQHLHRLRGDGVVAHQIAHAVAQRGPGRSDFRIRRRSTDFPACRSTPP